MAALAKSKAKNRRENDALLHACLSEVRAGRRIRNSFCSCLFYHLQAHVVQQEVARYCGNRNSEMLDNFAA